MPDRALAIAACALFSALAGAQTPSFFLIGAPAGSDFTRINGISADGSAAAGNSSLPNRAAGFTWTASGGRYDFGLLPGMPNTTSTLAISGDATTVVGTVTDA